MESLIITLESFKLSLVKGHASALKDRMSFYDNELLRINNDFHKITIDSDPEIKSIVEDLLNSLHIPKNQWSRYTNEPLTVYDFLVELRDATEGNDSLRKENNRINEFIDRIDEQIRARWKKIIYGSALILAAAECAAPFFAASGGLTALQGVLAAAAFVPLVGIIYTTADLAYSIYNCIRDKKIPLTQRILHSTFLVVQSAIKYAGYGLLVAAAAATSPPIVAALFVVASAVVVVREIASLVRMNIQESRHLPLSENASLSERQHQARHENDYIKRKNALYINIASAVVGVGLVAASVFIPGGIFVLAGLAIGVGAVYLADLFARRYNDKVMAKRLTNKFEALERAEASKQKSLTPTSSTSNVMSDESDDSAIDVLDRTDSPDAPGAWRKDLKSSAPSVSGMFSAVQTDTDNDLQVVTPTPHSP